MRKISEYIKSGIIEFYVLGLASALEVKEAEEMAAAHNEVGDAINDFAQILEQQALLNAIAPDPVIKPMLLATIDYIARMENGEPVSFPPVLHEGSKIADYREWLIRESMALPQDFKDIYARIIGYTPEVTTAIVWIKSRAPEEVHTNEIEKFLIVEGSCKIIIEKDINKLAPGDFLSIPLFKNHRILVTSEIPCKVILQRAAA